MAPDDRCPADRDDVRPPARGAQVRHDPLERAPSRSARSAVAAWWTVAPRSSSSRTPGFGGSVGGPDRTRWTARPARAPAAAVRRAWLDQRRPGRDEAVGALRQRGADQELEVAQLVAAEGEREQVLALDPDLGAAAERRREPRQRLRAATARRAARTAGTGPDRASRQARADGTRLAYHRAMAVRITPTDRHTTVGQHPGMERSIAISSADRRLASGSTRRSCRPRPATRPGSTTTATARRRSTSCPGPPAYTWGPTGLEHAFDAAAGDFIYIPAGEIHVEANASRDRAAGRRPDPQLPRFARRLPRRRSGRRRRRPGALLRAWTTQLAPPAPRAARARRARPRRRSPTTAGPARR